MASDMTPDATVYRMRRHLAGPLEAPAFPAGFTLRTFEKADARAVHALLETAYWAGGGGADKFSRWWPKLRKDPEFDPALCFLAEDADGLAGVAQCWTSGFVKDLAVHPRARKRGLGRALMLTVFAAFRARGWEHVDLKVQADNPSGAVALYRALGMEVVETLRL
jgi:ribosomal protein S18 acetylase RimI-like enzyme